MNPNHLWARSSAINSAPFTIDATVASQKHLKGFNAVHVSHSILKLSTLLPERLNQRMQVLPDDLACGGNCV